MRRHPPTLAPAPLVASLAPTRTVGNSPLARNNARYNDLARALADIHRRSRRTLASSEFGAAT